VVHERGCSIAKRLPALRGDFGVEYRSADGSTATVETDRLQLVWMDAPAEGIDRNEFGATVTGTFTPAEAGEWQFGLTSVGAASLRIDGRAVIDIPEPLTGGAFFGMGSPEVRAAVHLEAGRPVTIEVEYPLYAYGMLRGLIVGAEPPLRNDAIERAVSAASSADVAVLVVGTNDDWETEGEDRVTMALPGEQDELIAQVAAANPNTVVVINAGSPVSMPWLHRVRAVMQVWFPGEEFGEALADVLLGAAEPGGRLPVTLPVRLDDTPAFLHHPGRDGKAVYAEGLSIGYRWYDARGIQPLFPFGHGLGYTTFTIEALSISGSIGEGVDVRAMVRNTGSRTGSQVVQCYVQPDGNGPERPLRTLQGFAKVTLEPGQQHEVEIWLPERCFAVWDVGAHDWVVPAGAYTVLVGESSRSLQVAGTISAPG
jgi:beta-glucosidase